MPRRLQLHVDGFYLPILKKALEWRYFTVACGVAIAVVTAGFVAGRVPFTFLPKIEGDVITAQLQMPGGTPVAETERITNRIAAAALRVMVFPLGKTFHPPTDRLSSQVVRLNKK